MYDFLCMVAWSGICFTITPNTIDTYAGVMAGFCLFLFLCVCLCVCCNCKYYYKVLLRNFSFVVIIASRSLINVYSYILLRKTFPMSLSFTLLCFFLTVMLYDLIPWVLENVFFLHEFDAHVDHKKKTLTGNGQTCCQRALLNVQITTLLFTLTVMWRWMDLCSPQWGTADWN